eukprot:TRINITY_DN91177_c0_g1_i1.p1 TRINITY_DN91177_c0_g1~~TRINITY_DN91177_c0_g1_i1.p1  ORF type:complete len:247 (+),score=81.35 TRINITY_DN91177_c0_g1_i1:56-796(+)
MIDSYCGSSSTGSRPGRFDRGTGSRTIVVGSTGGVSTGSPSRGRDQASWRDQAVHAHCLEEAATLRSLLEDVRVAAQGFQVDRCRNEAQEQQLLVELAELCKESAKKRRSLDLLEAEESAWLELNEELQDFFSSDTAAAAAEANATWTPLDWLEEKMAGLLKSDALLEEENAPKSARLCDCVEGDVLPPSFEPSDEQRLLLQKRQELNDQINELQQMQIRVRRYGSTLMKAYAAHSNGDHHYASQQ